MKVLKNKAQKALVAAVTMSLVMGVCGSAMAIERDAYYGQKNGEFLRVENAGFAPVSSGFMGDWDKDSPDGGSIYGGSDTENPTTTAKVEGNTVNILGGTFEKWARIYGGDTYNYSASEEETAVAEGNTVNILGGTFEKSAYIYGARAYGEGVKVTVTAEGNTVNLLGGTFEQSASIYGGYTENYNGTAVSKNNTVCIGGYIKEGKVVTADEAINAPNLTVYGGYAKGNSQTSSGNTVKVMSAGNTIKALNMDSIQNLEFYIPAGAKDGDTLLTVSRSVDLSNANIKAGLENSSELKEGKITLISANEISGFDKDGQPIEKVSIGDFTERDLIYDFTDGKNLNAVITAPKPKDDNPDSKSPVETQAAGLTMLTTGADMLASAGFDNAASAVASEVSAGGSANVMTPFMAMGGAKTKVKSGSHVDVKGWNLNIGLAKEIDNKAGKLLIGPVVEYGKGSYDSYLDNGFHGEGDTDYIGGGVMAKQTNDNGFYYEGSLRAGKLSNDYKSNTGKYDSDSTYYAAHVGLGKIVKLSEKNSLDYYGKYFYTHQKGDDTTLYDNGTPIDLHFDSVDSNRTRIGGRFTHDVNEKNSVYAGLAWQHEFSGTARATLGTSSTPAPSVKGNTGIMELGWKVNANKNLDLDLGATGYTGKQKGASLNLALNFKF